MIKRMRNRVPNLALAIPRPYKMLSMAREVKHVKKRLMILTFKKQSFSTRVKSGYPVARSLVTETTNISTGSEQSFPIIVRRLLSTSWLLSTERLKLLLMAKSQSSLIASTASNGQKRKRVVVPVTRPSGEPRRIAWILVWRIHRLRWSTLRCVTLWCEKVNVL